MTARAGFRLARLEVFNWGTFGGAVWTLDARGENTLLTGDIGSGKSTLVDAVTTLLVPPQRLAYNRAAGADARERTLRSYVLGYYKSERGDVGGAARAVPLRDKNSFSVVLGVFENAEAAETVSLAQVFWLKDLEGQPDRFYVVGDRALAIATDFAGFGDDILALRKRLRRSGCEIEDSFARYAASFRRRFGIEDEQALELFHQTVSMKSVGNLTDFVRNHMLQPFPVEERIAALVGHFTDLDRAHAAVLKAKAQVALLDPIVADCERHAELTRGIEGLRRSRDGLRPWFARRKGELLDERLESLRKDLARLAQQRADLDDERARRHGERDDLKRAIAQNGGDRLESIRGEVARLTTDLLERRARSERYDEVARGLGFPAAHDGDQFAENLLAVEGARATSEAELNALQERLGDVQHELRELRAKHEEIATELTSLRSRRSNIPGRTLAVRGALCQALDLREDEIPFAGELLQVQPGEGAWEGAIERVLRSFGLSLLVPEAHYPRVAEWVDRTHLDARLVYFRVREMRGTDRARVDPRSLVNKVTVKPQSQFWAWLDAELSRRFDLVCCETLDELRREARGITRLGQMKGGERHEKDDRTRIDDRSRYVLGWTNEAKIAAYEKQARDLEARIQDVGSRLAGLFQERTGLNDRLGTLKQLEGYHAFRELDWQPLSVRVEALREEATRLQAESNLLATLTASLEAVERVLASLDKQIEALSKDVGALDERQASARRARQECAAVLEGTAAAVLGALDELDAIVASVLGDHALTVESCDGREKDAQRQLQARIDADGQRAARLGDKIASAMTSYRGAYPLDTREADASVEAAGEYAAMLARLRSDDLPRFEARFKELLNENTIREIAGFQSHLAREREDIKERIATINRSLAAIDYNPNRYIRLEPDLTHDIEIRQFQQELRACTEGALSGAEDEVYSEGKFLAVKRIIERFRGREGTGELDARWTRKVTDVRQWFTFSASERWREDDAEHEHYTDSGGKSGGQKEKLAYTVLAASLAYRFGLAWDAQASRTFRFVVIDEAFGRGSDDSTRYALELFARLDLQLLIVTPLQKIQVIEPHVASVGFVHNEEGRRSMVRNLTVEEYRAERAGRRASAGLDG